MALVFSGMLDFAKADSSRAMEDLSNHIEAITKAQLDWFSAQLIPQFDDHLQQVIHQLTKPPLHQIDNVQPMMPAKLSLGTLKSASIQIRTAPPNQS